MKNLWPNIEKEHHETTPKEFLAGQITFLSELTNGRLQGTITSITASAIMDKDTRNDFTGELFIHSMKIVSPSLGYSFTLLRLAHQTLKIFPFAVYSSLTDKKYNGVNIDDLEGILAEIFKSTEVVEAIKALSSQSEKPEFEF